MSSEELARFLDLKELDEKLYMFQAVSAYDEQENKLSYLKCCLKPNLVLV